MDLESSRGAVLGHDVMQQIKKARRATWGPTPGRQLDLTYGGATSLEDANGTALRRAAATASLSRPSTAVRERPATARLAPTPEEPPMDRSHSQRRPSVKRQSISAMEKRKTFASGGTLRIPMQMATVRRWDGRLRRITPWDGLQRDAELYNPSGELLVHLHARGHSRRGPSFRVSLNKIHKMGCGPMFTLCFADETAESRGRRMPGAPRIYEIFIPSPEYALREEAMTWHLTTRNFFAFVLNKPLVAAHLGRALVDLQERLYIFRSEEVDNCEDLMTYMSNMGYLNFGHNPDFALAVLYFAEHYQLRELWIDAFAHCVGMSHLVVKSFEYEQLRSKTQTLITRAYFEMDLHLTKCWKSMASFLEDELSEAHLGLSIGARAHLDRFRSFLHQYYVEKFGYWPPSRNLRFPRSTYKSMYFDFRSLYEYLVDASSADSMLSQRLASGGICVLQNLQAFNGRHKYPPLPHPLPLIPDSTTHVKFQSQRALLARTLGSRSAKSSRQYSARAALYAATNTGDIAIVNSPLVKAFRQFERDHGHVTKEEKVSLADARKVRWILVYSILQTLIAITRAPKEVRDTEGAGYPLCCLTTGLPPWEEEATYLVAPLSKSMSAFPELERPSTNSSVTFDSNGMPNAEKPAPTSSAFEIHPDCENDTGYFSQGRSRNNSTQSLTSLLKSNETNPTTPSRSTTPPALRRNTSTMSQRSIKTLSFSNFGSRRNSIVKAPQPAFCEIIVHGYGNGLNQTITNKQKKPVEMEPAPAPVELPASMPELPVSPVSSMNSSTSTIIAPKPLRPMSAKEKKSFTMPTDFSRLDVHSGQESLGAPAVDISALVPPPLRSSKQVNDRSPAPVSNKAPTPVSSGDTTDSDHENNVSPVWSSRRGSASSQSSADLSPTAPERQKHAASRTKLHVVTKFDIDDARTNLMLRDVGGLLTKLDATSTTPANSQAFAAV